MPKNSTRTSAHRIGVLVLLAASLIANAAAAASCDVVKGQKTYQNKCGICHVANAGEASTVGPSLYQVVGREIGKIKEFSYSDVLAAANGEWTAARLNQFLISPQTAFPGTAMPFQGLSSETDRANIICYLQANN